LVANGSLPHLWTVKPPDILRLEVWISISCLAALVMSLNVADLAGVLLRDREENAVSWSADLCSDFMLKAAI
jgi:hypothetical protein